MKRRVVFEYWQHPLGPDDEYVEESERAEEEDEFSEHEGGELARPILMTAAGLIPLQPYTDLTKAFKFFMGHTNFTIDDKTVNMIEEFPGVETLDILTRYRFRVGIGKIFDDEDVRKGLRAVLVNSEYEMVEENPQGHALTPEMVDRIETIKAGFEDARPYWASLVLPNGNVDFIRGSDKEVVAERLDLYRTLQESVGGVIFQNVRH